ncbi:flagellar motor switch protein FliM [Rhodovulum iodosum]|uniref:Flagellar motor switch protein FliM n=1 Tax=Rhodovulum iodosum TaxID=68291 RepID=A0ABV3XND1_9RHOB|nr:FliM/FliN family flagellar motor C-terminal domain-containing protein [Rhodovulum robiginosum]RSK34718.1 FliM/FliN family flagellar motor switch protein [Rhodovulum robiginosum]
MTGEAHRALIRRMAGGAGPVPGGDAPALAPALIRAAQDEFGLALRVTATETIDLPIADLAEAIPCEGLILRLAGADGVTGAAAFDGALAAALLEQRLTGQLGATPPAPRRFTRTDAALLHDFAARALAALASPALAPAGRIEAARLVPLALTARCYRMDVFDLSLGGGAREGRFRLALPLAEAAPAAARGTARPAAAAWAAALRASVGAAHAPCNAVMARESIPLGRLRALKPGDLLPLAADALNGVRLEGAGGAVLATGRLGQSQGHRAVRIAAGPPGAPPLPAPGD